jgi:hypothetical protein
MRLRPVVWPVVLLWVSGCAAFSTFLVARSSDPWSSSTWGMVAFCLFIWLPLRESRQSVQLTPEGIYRWKGTRRHKQLTVIPWGKVQGVALTGDTAHTIPTVWLEDGRTVVLTELREHLTIGARRVQRHYRHIAEWWQAHRGPTWQPAPWASEVVPGWVPGPSGAPDAVTPVAITAWLQPAWRWRAALVAGLLAVVAGVMAIDGFFADWRWYLDLIWVVPAVAVLLPVIWYGLVVRVSAYGVDGTPWPRVQAVALARGRRSACPTLRLEDGEVIKLFQLGEFFGRGSVRAIRMTDQLQQAWLAHRGPTWCPIPPPLGVDPPLQDRPDANHGASPEV